MNPGEGKDTAAARLPANGQIPAARTPIVRRAPLIPVAVAMAAGIAIGRYLPLPVGIWASAALVGLLAAVGTLRWEHLRAVTTVGIFAAVGLGSAAAGTLAYHHIPTDHIATFSRDSTILATVRGRIASAPRVREPPAPYWLARTSFLLAAESIRKTDGQWLSTSGLVRVKVDESAGDLAAGSQVEVVGSLRRFRPPLNPGAYDWAAANRTKGILVSLHVPGRDGVTELAAAPVGGLSGLWRRLRAMARQHVAGCGEGDDAVLLEAVVLGERDPSLRELNRAMAEAGVAHFLSISGLHLGIFLGFVYWLGRVLMFSPRRSAAAVLVVLATYVLLAEPRAPLLRGALMAAAFCVAAISGRSVPVGNALAAAAIVLLAVDPMQLFSPGFQLSFAIVTGIVVLRGPLRAVIFGAWLRRRGLMVFRGDRRIRRWLYYRGANAAIHLVSLSLAAYISAAPLVAYHFGLFSPYAPLLSILLLPVMVAVLVPAYVSMALALMMPNLAWQVGRLAGLAAGAMRWLVMHLQHLPSLSSDVFPLPVWLVALIYAVMGLWVLTRWRRCVFVAASVGTVAVVVAVVLTQLPAPAPPNGQLHALAVGHGAMTLLHAPDGRTYLFDAGTLAPLDAYQQVLRPFLRAKRLASPEAVFISHANVDHYNALPGLLGRAPPKRVYIGTTFGLRDDEPPSAAKLLADIQDRGIEVIRLAAGQAVRLGRETSAEVLWPPEDRTDALDLNDSSLVLRLVCRGRSVLLPGDAGQAVEAELAARGDAIAADVLVLPHHGSATPTLKAFIEAVGASHLVQSNSFRYESPALLEAIAGRKRYVTYRNGWVCVDLATDNVRVRTMRD